MNNIKQVSKKQKAYDYMKSKIMEGFYVPGQRIVINQLVKELATSAIPIREAVRQLEAEGLIEYQQNIGPVVTPIDESEYIDTLSTLAVLEGYATALSKTALTDKKIKILTDLNQQMKGALAEFEFGKFGELNRRFHDLTYDNCPNHYLIESIRKTWMQLDSIRLTGSTFNPKRAKESINEHEHIIQLLSEDADFQLIEAAVRSHKLNTVKSYHERKRQPNGTTFI